jgi:hypothetical protein
MRRVVVSARIVLDRVAPALLRQAIDVDLHRIDGVAGCVNEHSQERWVVILEGKELDRVSSSGVVHKVVDVGSGPVACVCQPYGLGNVVEPNVVERAVPLDRSMNFRS